MPESFRQSEPIYSACSETELSLLCATVPLLLADIHLIGGSRFSCTSGIQWMNLTQSLVTALLMPSNICKLFWHFLFYSQYQIYLIAAFYQLSLPLRNLASWVTLSQHIFVLQVILGNLELNTLARSSHLGVLGNYKCGGPIWATGLQDWT